jgi:mannose-6-phosphate isomerase
MMREDRPWGSFTVLDEGQNYKVKRIEVLPKKRLSYQKHKHRAEHWMVVAGVAKVTLDGNEITVATGEVVDVPIESAQIQRGAYLGEDDIQRLQDDFGRSS